MLTIGEGTIPRYPRQQSQAPPPRQQSRAPPPPLKNRKHPPPRQQSRLFSLSYSVHHSVGVEFDANCNAILLLLVT